LLATEKSKKLAAKVELDTVAPIPSDPSLDVNGNTVAQTEKI
jgi:hypothetical protein